MSFVLPATFSGAINFTQDASEPNAYRKIRTLFHASLRNSSKHLYINYFGYPGGQAIPHLSSYHQKSLATQERYACFNCVEALKSWSIALNALDCDY